MSRYSYMAFIVLLAACAPVIAYAVQRHRRSGHDQKRSWVSYLTVWPVILDADRSKRNGRILTRREWFGWAIVGLLIAGGIFINSRF